MNIENKLLKILHKTRVEDKDKIDKYILSFNPKQIKIIMSGNPIDMSIYLNELYLAVHDDPKFRDKSLKELKELLENLIKEDKKPKTQEKLYLLIQKREEEMKTLIKSNMSESINERDDFQSRLQRGEQLSGDDQLYYEILLEVTSNYTLEDLELGFIDANGNIAIDLDEKQEVNYNYIDDEYDENAEIF